MSSVGRRKVSKRDLVTAIRAMDQGLTIHRHAIDNLVEVCTDMAKALGMKLKICMKCSNSCAVPDDTHDCPRCGGPNTLKTAEELQSESTHLARADQPDVDCGRGGAGEARG